MAWGAVVCSRPIYKEQSCSDQMAPLSKSICEGTGRAASFVGRHFLGKYLLHIDKVKNNSVGCWLMSLRKLFLCYENMSYPYGTYYVPGIDACETYISLCNASNNPRSRYFSYSKFLGEEAETQVAYITCPRSGFLQEQRRVLAQDPGPGS